MATFTLTREFCRDKFSSDKNTVSNVILFVPSKLDVIVFEEGSGSQLIDEDYAEGIDSYIMASVVNVDTSYDELGIVDGDGEQYPFFYSTEKVDDEFDLIYDWLESYYETVPDFVVLRQ